MIERPILFSGPMVRALLDGHKTQTRRVVKPQPDFDAARSALGGDTSMATVDVDQIGGLGLRRGDGMGYVQPNAACPYGRNGDRLWVRETARCSYRSEQPPTNRGCIGVEYQAGGSLTRNYTLEQRDALSWFPRTSHNADGAMRWTPAIHMPRWASRITLEVTGVRVERLNNISDADAAAEGWPGFTEDSGLDAMAWYSELWDSLNASRGYGWEANPWVWVVEFRRVAP